jgi:hypothetical protein
MNSNSGCPTAYATGIHEDFVKDTSRGDPLHALLYLTVQAGVILSMLYCILQFMPGWSSPCSTVSYSSSRGDPLHALLYLTVQAGVILSMLYCILQFMPGWSSPCSTVSYSSCRGDPLHALLYLTVHAGVILSMLYCILQFHDPFTIRKKFIPDPRGKKAQESRIRNTDKLLLSWYDSLMILW